MSNQTPRPRLTPDTVPAFLDWTLDNASALPNGGIEHHLRAAELVVRLKMGDAQNKATQHTLVEDGVIDPPPQAS